MILFYAGRLSADGLTTLHSFINRTIYKAVETFAPAFCKGFYFVLFAFFNAQLDLLIVCRIVLCNGFLLRL